MKIYFCLPGLYASSYLRAASLQYRKSENPGKMQVIRYLGWIREKGKDFECNIDDVMNEANETYPSSISQFESISGIDNVLPTYIVTNVEYPFEDSYTPLCYGSYYFEIDVSSVNSFEHDQEGCCSHNYWNSWIYYRYKAVVNDVNNSSPQFIPAPIWYLLFGCQDQVYRVNAVDPEGDNVSCRWSYYSEVKEMAFNLPHGFRKRIPPFSLDEENCVVTYHPELDDFGEGWKVIALQVEDWDVNGNLLHSVPLVLTGALQQTRSNDEPDYCTGRPTFGNSPYQGEELFYDWKSGQNIELEWKADYILGSKLFHDFPRYQFMKIPGMRCSAFDVKGEATCSWIPTAEQANQELHQHCVVVYDPIDRPSEYRCVNLRFYPLCDLGTERVGAVCLDVDECSAGTHNCAFEKQICVNTDRSFACDCAGGFELNASGVCVNVDECTRGTDTCNGVTEICNDTQGSFTCSCASGYAADSAKTCVDIDECTAGSHNCAPTIENCVNNIGSFTCSCFIGYKRNDEGVCVDIDECVRGTDTCATTVETCINTIGSFDCLCSSGYEQDDTGVCVDIDECVRGTDTCATTIETCGNTVGSFECSCSSGYDRDADGVCVDIDECVRETDTCAETIEICVNTIGSFTCPCSVGYERNDAGVCSDIDECAQGTDSCTEKIERCVNTIGSFRCSLSPLFCLLYQNNSNQAMSPYMLFTRYFLCKNADVPPKEILIEKLDRLLRLHLLTNAN